MDARMNDQQQKDYISSFFPSAEIDQLHNGTDTTDLGGMQQAVLNAQQNPSSLHLDMNILGNLMAMHGLDSNSNTSSQSQFQHANSNPASQSQVTLEQQFKLQQLQQLQQLQNQIFQQQIALISGQSNNSFDAPIHEHVADPPANPFHGLLTPGSSTELRAQQQPLEYISPMNLNYLDPPPAEYGDAMTAMPQPMNPHFQLSPRGASSAPAHIVFRTNSVADVDVDISPLTSPWLGAQQHQSTYVQRNKRTASSSGDESSSKPSKKKQSPAIRPHNSAPAPKRTSRTSKSVTSTPLLRSTTRPRTGSIIGNEAVGDSPSPVDLSMPPPASTTSHTSISTAPSLSDASHPSPSLIPVTPASIMNLGRPGVHTNNLAARSSDKGQSPVKVAPSISQRSRSTRRGSVGVSPALKPILPAGSVPTSSMSSGGAPVVQVRKTSHKAAEQKRRDSLKNTFDDLRGLLPPIPPPSDGRNIDEPMLPGALPPRGPPKAGSDGPNKAVSKLQLLMCGNDFIRQLKGRVERRDEEINKLRREVAWLRNAVVTTSPHVLEEVEPVDLDKDLDEIELMMTGLGQRGIDEDADEEGDVDE